MTDKPITSDDLFGPFRSDPEYIREHRRIAPATNLAINVLRLRTNRGWSQAQLASEAGMRQPRIADIEAGSANPRLDTLARIAQALGVGSEDLLIDQSSVHPVGIEFIHKVVPIERDAIGYPASWDRLVTAIEKKTWDANERFAHAG